MGTFLDDLNAKVLTEEGEESLKREFIKYIDEELFPYWIKREYEEIKKEIENKAKLGEFKIENEKKVIEGKFSFSSILHRRNTKEISKFIYLDCYSKKNEIPLFEELRSRGINEFGKDFPCKAYAEIKQAPKKTLIVFKYGYCSTRHANASTIKEIPMGEIEWKNETRWHGLFNRYKVTVPILVKLTNSFKDIYKAFTQIAQKDSVKIGLSFIEQLNSFSEANEIIIDDFDKEIRFTPANDWTIIPNYEENLEAKYCHVEAEVLSRIYFTYRVEF